MSDTKNEITIALLDEMFAAKRSLPGTLAEIAEMLARRGFSPREIDEHLIAALSEARRRYTAAQGSGL